MQTIKESINNKIIINKSIFITDIIKVYSKNEAQESLDSIKRTYKDATHYCYAYIVDNDKKSSDDGEPGGTAGVPIMEVLNKLDLNYVICIVTRYFGGIKLGAGGLVRAYAKSVSTALNQSEDKMVQLVDGYEIKLEVPYDKQKEIEHILNCKYTKYFDEVVTYVVECEDTIKNLLTSKYKVLEIKRKKIEII